MNFICFVCYDHCISQLDSIDTLWDDRLWIGKVICFFCNMLIEKLRPRKLNYKIPDKKIGLEKWV